MKSKLLSCLALVLSGGLFGCSTVCDRPAAPPSAAAVGTYIAKVHMIDARHGWAWSSGDEYGSNVLHNTPLLHTADGGETWQDRTPRAFSYIGEGGCFLDAQTAWVSTLDQKSHRGGLLHTQDGGKSWSVLIKQGAAAYGCLTESSECHFFNANDGVANTADYGAGSVHVCFYETHNGGMDWSPVGLIPPGGRYPNEPPGTIGLSDIAPEKIGYCPPANAVITHGDLDDEKPKDAVRLSVTADLGNSWRDVKLPLPSEKYRDGLVECGDPVFLQGKDGWLPVRILKRNQDESVAWNVMVFYTTHDGGETWTPRPGIIEGGTNQFVDYGQFNVVPVSDIFLRAGAKLFATHDGAESWQAIKPNLDFERTAAHGGVSQMDFVDAKHGWAVVYDTFNHFPHDKHYLYQTSDGGATWTELPLKIAR